MNDLDKLLNNENHDNIITSGLRASFEKDGITVSEDLMAKTLARIAQLDSDKQAGGSEVNKFIMAEEDFAISGETELETELDTAAEQNDGSEETAPTEKQTKVIDIASRRRKIRVASGIAAAVVVAVLGISLISNGLMGASKSAEYSTANAFLKDVAKTEPYAMVADTACAEDCGQPPMSAEKYEDSKASAASTYGIAAPNAALFESNGVSDDMDGVAEGYIEEIEDIAMFFDSAPTSDEEETGSENGGLRGESSSMMVGSGNPFASKEGYDGEDNLLVEIPREALKVSRTVFTSKQEMPDAETAYNNGFAFFTKGFFEKLTAEVTDDFISGELKDVETGSTVSDGAVYGQFKLIDISDTDYVLFSYILFNAVDENGDTVVRGFGEGKIRTVDSLTRYLISGDKAEMDEDYRGAEKGSLDQGLWEDVEVNRYIVPEGNVWEIRYTFYDDTFYYDEVGYGLFSYHSKLFFDENGASVFMTKHYCPDGDMDTPYEIYFVRDDKLIFTGYWDNHFMGDYSSSDGRYVVAVNGLEYNRVLDMWYDGALLVHDDDMYHGY